MQEQSKLEQRLMPYLETIWARKLQANGTSWTTESLIWEAGVQSRKSVEEFIVFINILHNLDIIDVLTCHRAVTAIRNASH